MSRLIDKYLSGVEVRRTVFNWPDEIKNIVDGYRSHTTVSHAVQKDAIQNGWSARRNKRSGRDWVFIFELVKKGDRTFLVMTDTGTTGLTGRILKAEEYEKDLSAEERWGRFEGVAFTQPRAERTLGSRGRGKFIFVGASREHTILYDTVRSDGTYRFGFRTVIRTESPVAAYDEEEGKQKLREMTDGLLEPLSSVGTRVIIVNPDDELIRDLRRGRFVRFIGETWWEILLKYGARITIRVDGSEHITKIPDEYRLEEKDSRDFKVWIKPPKKISLAGREFRIKRLHIVYNAKNPVPDDIRGIAIQRNGMKICSIEPKYLGREISERLYGYITLDRATEEFLLEDEGVEHYSFNFGPGSLPKAIRRYVEDEMERFAHEKLGWGADVRELRRQQQRNAERRALVAVNRFARKIGIGVGPGGRPRGLGGRRTAKEVRIQMDDLSLPRAGDLRVNYGETVGNMRARVINESDYDIFVQFKLFLRFYDKLIKLHAQQDISIKAGEKSGYFGPYQETFMEEMFPNKGRYTVEAKIISLRDQDKGTKLDVEIRSFYLEEDPPPRGLFERCDPIPYPERAKMVMAESITGERKGLILQYNINHPAQIVVADSEDDLAAYLGSLMSYEMCRYDLLQKKPALFEQAERDDPDSVLRKTLRVTGELLYRFRRGEFD